MAWFTVRVEQRNLSFVCLPKYISDMVTRQGGNTAHVQRHDDNSKTFDVKIIRVNTKTGHKFYLGDGWEVFVAENGIFVDDILNVTVEDDDLFKVVIWRGGSDITVEVILVSSDSSDDEGRGGDATDDRVVQNPPPNMVNSFTFTFLYSYIFKPTINVPVNFARAHFGGLKDPCKVQLQKSQSWTATMHIRKDSRGKITSCNIKKGVPEFISGEGVEEDAKVLVELTGMGPPTLRVSFI